MDVDFDANPIVHELSFAMDRLEDAQRTDGPLPVLGNVLSGLQVLMKAVNHLALVSQQFHILRLQLSCRRTQIHPIAKVACFLLGTVYQVKPHHVIINPSTTELTSRSV